jgi:hypothetical protein
MATFYVIGSLSIGIFFIPSIAALILAISRTER